MVAFSHYADGVEDGGGCGEVACGFYELLEVVELVAGGEDVVDVDQADDVGWGFAVDGQAGVGG